MQRRWCPCNSRQGRLASAPDTTAVIGLCHCGSTCIHWCDCRDWITFCRQSCVDPCGSLNGRQPIREHSHCTPFRCDGITHCPNHLTNWEGCAPLTCSLPWSGGHRMPYSWPCTLEGPSQCVGVGVRPATGCWVPATLTLLADGRSVCASPRDGWSGWDDVLAPTPCCAYIALSSLYQHLHHSVLYTVLTCVHGVG